MAFRTRRAGNASPMQHAIAIALIIVIISGAYYFVFRPNTTTTTVINGQTVTLPGASTPPPAGIYTGTVSFLVNEYWEYDGSGLAYTSAVVNIYHTNGLTIAGAPTIGGSGGAGTATNIVESAADNGAMVMGYLAAKSSVAFLDPVYTMAQNQGNKGGLKSIAYNLDPNNDGVYDIEFAMDLSGFSNTNPNLTPSVTVNLYGWKVSTTTVSITASSTPVSMNAAGTYVASGYIGDTNGNGYEDKISTWILWASHDDTANTTASSFSTLITAGTVQLLGVGLWGTGAFTGTKYGATWGNTIVSGVPNYPLPSYDSTNTRWVLYQPNNPSSTPANVGQGDVSQIEWGMPIVFERNSAANWFGYTITLKTAAGAFTATGYYNIFLEGRNMSGTASSDQSSDALELKLVLKGGAA